ncbi:MAG: methyltransferase domain-containing protein [Patescibacteria group bacterium]|jgi:2-polyprenyl-3-methyl-5-hydroxy-6-metoxy-1,4-benzoquinol methylase
MKFVCPKDHNSLIKDDTKYYCEKCNTNYPIINNIPRFTEVNFYWGEIPESNMDKMLTIIKDKGYHAGLDYLEENFPGRSKFVFNISRSDWHFAVDIKPGMKILDLGCGWGTHSFPLADLGAEVYAVDITKQRVEFVEARKKIENKENIYPLVGNVMELPFENESFDLIISNGVLEWVGLQEQYGKPREVQEKFLKLMRGLLKKDGILYVGIENRFALSYFAKGIDHSGLRYTSLMPRFLANTYTQSKLKKPYLTYTYTYNGYKKLFNKIGFNKIDTYIPFSGYNNPNSLVPYKSSEALQFFMLTRGKFNNIKLKLLKYILFNRLFLKLYRFFSFSFDFYLKK